MAHLCCLKNFIIIGCKQVLRVYSVEDGSCVFTYTHEFDKAITDGSNKPLDDRLEDLCTSPNEKYICAVYSDKRLVVITFDNEWDIAKVITVKRRPTSMCFDSSSELLFVADKSGDLYQYTLNEDEIKISSNGEISEDLDPLLGHVSMLLDVKVTMNGKYILTADRDEKIRVSELRNPYVIESFCLGHTEFVCTIEPLPSEKMSLILSSSGDSTIRMWDVVSGKELEKYDFEIPNNGDDINNSDDKMQFIPSIITCSLCAKYFAVASSQNNMSKVSMFNLNMENLSFDFHSGFNIEDFLKIEDMRFGLNGNDKLLYVMGTLNEDNNLSLRTYRLDENNLFTLFELPCLDMIEDNLKGVVFKTIDLFQPLFKVKSDGEVYSSYQKKKEERLSAKLQNIGVDNAKRVKLDASS